MRLLFCLFLLFSLASPLSAQQKVLSFSEAENKGISIEEIDQQYPDAVHANPQLANFTENQSEFIEQYKSFIQKLAVYLNENGFYWNEPKQVFNRIYFSENGTVDYFFYNEEHADFNKEKMDTFNQLTSEFISSYSLKIDSESPYAQCSPVLYSNIINPDEDNIENQNQDKK